MKKLRSVVFAVAAVAALGSVYSCNKTGSVSTSQSVVYYDNTESDVYQENSNIGVNEIKADLSNEASANETGFTLNNVYSSQQMDDGMKYVYLDVSINNDTGTAYSLSTLNNFYLILNDGTEVYSDIRTQLYAANHFKEGLFFGDPFDIPANGTFKGIIGGFLIKKDVTDFTVCFFPTQGAPNDKEDVVKIDITAADLKDLDDTIIDH